MRRVASNGDPKRFNQARRPKYLFSGLTKCAECGGGYVMYWRDRLACFGARSRGTCTNRLTISRQEVEERVLVALRDKLMRRDLFEDVCREYVRELNRLRIPDVRIEYNIDGRDQPICPKSPSAPVTPAPCGTSPTGCRSAFTSLAGA